MHEKIAQYCFDHLNLQNAELSEEYFYASLPFCIIDAVYSLAARYSSTRNAVIRFCKVKGLQRLRQKGSPFLETSKQYSVQQFDDFLSQYNNYQQIAVDIFKNEQRTSSRNGILKAEAVHKFTRVLLKYNVNYFQDISKVINDLQFERDICFIPGQTYGTALTYFFMLAGDDNKVKPDRMIFTFLKRILGDQINKYSLQEWLFQTLIILNQTYPKLTLRLLDNVIWKYERELK